MNKPMDSQARSLIMMMNHHLTHEYTTEEGKQRNLDAHLDEFTHYSSLPVTQFSVDVWDELNDLFTVEQRQEVSDVLEEGRVEHMAHMEEEERQGYEDR